MTLSRYKIREADLVKAKAYLNKKASKKNTPNWIVKNEKSLKVVGYAVQYNGLPIIPIEKADAYLRRLVFDTNSKTPLSRDGMFHLLKQQVAGISRRKIMNFLRAQSVVQKGKGAVPVPKPGGKPLKRFHMEFDLIFLKKRDVAKANPYFRDSELLSGKDNNGLTYIISVVEKVSGLTRLGFSKTKEARDVTPKVIRMMREIAKALKTDLSKIDASSDKGGEFAHKLIEKVVKSYKLVPTGPSIEKKNSDIQRVLFQRFRARAGKDVKKLIQVTQQIVNNNYNKILKQTPNESVEEKSEDVIKKYNSKRKQGADGKKLALNDYVRIRLLATQKDKKLEYKSYKDMLWSKKVYRVSALTKKTPIKYRVGKRWYLTGSLMKVRPDDPVSETIIKARDEKAQNQKDVAEQKKFEDAQKEINKMKARAEKLKRERARAEKARAEKVRVAESRAAESRAAEPVRRRSRRGAVQRSREKQLASEIKGSLQDRYLRAQQKQ